MATSMGTHFRACATILFFLAIAQAQFTIESLSFGHQDSISSDGTSIPGWTITGEGHLPQLLSDRIILTPPAPGNKRGALWADHQITYPEWTVDCEFRASGPERGSGNLQIWLTKDTSPAAAMASIYTVASFDGLVLSMDQYGGTGGSVRGFLNDGTAKFKTHHNVDALAFGHCTYPYRNLGRLTKLRIEQTGQELKVSIDDTTCFKSDQVQIPPGYYFGISAASAENPDSFDIARFVVSSTNSITREEVHWIPPPGEMQSPPQAQEPVLTNELPVSNAIPPSAESPSGQLSQGQSGPYNDAQFNQMVDHLQAVISNIDGVYHTLRAVDDRLHERHDELKDTFKNLPTVPYDQLNAMARRIEHIESVIEKLQQEIESRDYKEHLASLHEVVKDTHQSLSNLPDIMTKSMPKTGFFIFVVLGFNSMLIGSYLIYKRRRANSPKKWL